MKPSFFCSTCRLYPKLQFNSIIISSHKSEFLRKCTYYYFQVLPNICLKFQDFTKFTSNGTFLKSLVDSLSNPSFPLNLALNFITQNRRERTGYSLISQTYRSLCRRTLFQGSSFKRKSKSRDRRQISRRAKKKRGREKDRIIEG